MTWTAARLLLLGAALALLLATAAASAGASYRGFDSPTENIGCLIDANGARCDIRDHEWPTPPKPRSCELDYGGGVFIGRRGRADYLCAGDTTLNSGPALPYGRAARFGRFRCRSERTGVRCLNARDGHGFLISRQRVVLF